MWIVDFMGIYVANNRDFNSVIYFQASAPYFLQWVIQDLSRKSRHLRKKDVIARDINNFTPRQ